MKDKSTEELKQNYQIVKFLINFHQTVQPPLLKGKELEEYVNAGLDTLLEIRQELKLRGESI